MVPRIQKICRNATFLLKYAFYIVNSANFKKFQEIREINTGHLYQRLDQSTKGFLMFGYGYLLTPAEFNNLRHNALFPYIWRFAKICKNYQMHRNYLNLLYYICFPCRNLKKEYESKEASDGIKKIVE